MDLFHWGTTFTRPQCHKQALVLLLRRSLAKPELTTSTTLQLLVRGRLFGELEPFLFTANHLDGGHLVTHNLATDSVAGSSALRNLVHIVGEIFISGGSE